MGISANIEVAELLVYLSQHCVGVCCSVLIGASFPWIIRLKDNTHCISASSGKKNLFGKMFTSFVVVHWFSIFLDSTGFTLI